MNNFRQKKPSVIVIENNYIDMLVLKALLGRYINLCIAPDFKIAVTIISKFTFDMILLDHNSCKEKENLNTIKTKSANKDIKVCGIAGKEVEFLINEGFNDILTKPVCKEDVFNALNWHESQNYTFPNAKVLNTLYSVF